MQTIQTDGGSEFEGAFALAERLPLRSVYVAVSTGLRVQTRRTRRASLRVSIARESFNRTVRQECLGWQKSRIIVRISPLTRCDRH